MPALREASWQTCHRIFDVIGLSPRIDQRVVARHFEMEVDLRSFGKVAYFDVVSAAAMQPRKKVHLTLDGLIRHGFRFDMDDDVSALDVLMDGLFDLLGQGVRVDELGEAIGRDDHIDERR